MYWRRLHLRRAQANLVFSSECASPYRISMLRNGHADVKNAQPLAGNTIRCSISHECRLRAPRRPLGPLGSDFPTRRDRAARASTYWAAPDGRSGPRAAQVSLAGPFPRWQGSRPSPSLSFTGLTLSFCAFSLPGGALALPSRAEPLPGLPDRGLDASRPLEHTGLLHLP
jgi:hypothetical protein